MAARYQSTRYLDLMAPIETLSHQTVISLSMGQKQNCYIKGGYTLVTLPHIVTPYRDSVDGTRDRVTYQKLVTG